MEEERYYDILLVVKPVMAADRLRKVKNIKEFTQRQRKLLSYCNYNECEG